jgi:hypothetical protein
MKVDCPGAGASCGIVWELAAWEQKRRKRKTIFGEVQHHLYMRHHMDVIESHKVANEVLDKLYAEEPK